MVHKASDIKFSWALPFIVGQYYNIHWRNGIDFEHMAFQTSELWQENEGIVLRFNYTDAREYFKVGKWFSQQLQVPLLTQSASLIDPASCFNGEYFHDAANRLMFICFSGRNRKVHEMIDVTPVRCELTCPEDETDETVNPRESFERLWSDVSNWPDSTLPQEGDNVTIPFEWNLIMDVNPPKLNYL